MNEIYHVFAHGRSMDSIDVSSVLVCREFSFDFFDNLFTKRTHFGRTSYCHIFGRLVSKKEKKKEVIIKSYELHRETNK